MDRRIPAALCIITLILVAGLFCISRPVTGSWVCTDRLTESAMLTDEVTTLKIRADGTALFRSYGDYLGRYEIRQGYGRWEPCGPGKFRITIDSGIDVSCHLAGNCTYGELAPSSFVVDHDFFRDTVTYDPAQAPAVSSIRPFIRSIERDCSQGCEG